jgi:hypothetical protein
MSLMFLFLAGVGAAPAAVAGGTNVSENPYRAIFLRNLFGLRPVEIRTAPPPPAPSSTIVLTGITTILGDRRAFLEITPPAKPPQTAKQISCILAEGQREGAVEVVQIDPKGGSVKVSDNGTLTTLTFEKNGRKTSPTPSTSAAVLHNVHAFRNPLTRPSR